MIRAMLFSFFTGYFASSTGHFLISSLFDKEDDRRMYELSSYAYGYSFAVAPFLILYEKLNPKQLDNQDKKYLIVSFFFSGLIFGLAVMVSGIVRKINIFRI